MPLCIVLIFLSNDNNFHCKIDQSLVGTECRTTLKWKFYSISWHNSNSEKIMSAWVRNLVMGNLVNAWTRYFLYQETDAVNNQILSRKSAWKWFSNTFSVCYKLCNYNLGKVNGKVTNCLEPFPSFGSLNYMRYKCPFTPSVSVSCSFETYYGHHGFMIVDLLFR